MEWEVSSEEQAPERRPDLGGATAETCGVALVQSIYGGIALADLAYQGDELFTQIAAEAQLWLVTPAAAPKHTPQRVLISSVRERIETTLSHLWSRFVDRVLSRSWEGLWCTVKLKMLHYNLGLAGLLPA